MAESSCIRMPVLLVDQDPVFRRALAENLRSDGHLVVECASAELAIPAIHSQQCAALITEWVVCGSNGVRLADEFRAAREGPTVVVTAQANRMLEASVQMRAYARLLPKPVGYEELHEALHRLLEAPAPS